MMVEIATFKVVLDRSWRLAVVLVVSGLCVATSAQAVSADRARSIAVSYLQSRCGSFFYACNALVLTMGPVATGVNAPGQPQYVFVGRTFETKTRPLPFAPKVRSCIVGAGISPWGRILNGTKKCQTVTPAFRLRRR